MIYFECACVLLCVNVDRLKFKLFKKKKKKKLFENKITASGCRTNVSPSNSSFITSDWKTGVSPVTKASAVVGLAGHLAETENAFINGVSL